jgi:hypothetical protein
LTYQLNVLASDPHHRNVHQQQGGVLFLPSSSMVLALVSLMNTPFFLVRSFPFSKSLQQYHMQNQAVVGISHFSDYSVFYTRAMH